MNVVFDLGENRHVKLLIHSTKNENFEISSASYVLKKNGSDISESEGISNINGHVIDTVISPKEVGNYTLTVTYHIADEVLIESVGVYVS